MIFKQTFCMPQQSPLAPIIEQSHTAGFAPASASTPYGHPALDSFSECPPAPRLGDGNSMFMAPLSHLINPRSAALCTPSCGLEPTSFSAPYPIANLYMAPNMTLHSLKLCPIVEDHCQGFPNPMPINPQLTEALPFFQADLS